MPLLVPLMDGTGFAKKTKKARVCDTCHATLRAEPGLEPEPEPVGLIATPSATPSADVGHPEPSQESSSAAVFKALDKVTWTRFDAGVPAGAVGIVQRDSDAGSGRTLVTWPPGDGAPRAHATAELELRKDIAFEGKIVRGRNGDSGTFCTASFCGKEAELWEELVEKATQCVPCKQQGKREGGGEGEGAGLSTATVFLPGGDPRNGAHVVDPDCAEGKCFCHALYGSEKPWGCARASPRPSPPPPPKDLAFASPGPAAGANLPG